MRFLAVIVSLAVAALGLAGMIAPDTLLDFGRSLMTTNTLYVVAVVRVAIGILLLAVARGSRMPRALRVIGIVVVIAGVLTPFFGAERASRMIEWLASNGSTAVRLVGLAAMTLGLFLSQAVRARKA